MCLGDLTALFDSMSLGSFFGSAAVFGWGAGATTSFRVLSLDRNRVRFRIVAISELGSVSCKTMYKSDLSSLLDPIYLGSLFGFAAFF